MHKSDVGEYLRDVLQVSQLVFLHMSAVLVYAYVILRLSGLLAV